MNSKIIIFGLIGLMFIAGAYAATNYVRIGTLELNSTGLFYGGIKVTFGCEADVCVSKGTSVLDDAWKTFMGDTVCASTDNDCANELRVFQDYNNSHILIRGGTYNLSSNTTYGFFYLKGNNNILEGYGATFLVNIPSTVSNVDYLSGLHISGNGNLVKGLKMIGNNQTITDTTKARGISIFNSNDNTIQDCNVSNIRGFQYVVEQTNAGQWAERNHFIHDYGYGLGTNDVFAGGRVKDSSIQDSYCYQHTSGTYGTCIAWAMTDNNKWINNYVRGGMVWSYENGDNKNNLMENNHLFKSISSDNIATDCRVNNTNNVYRNNILEDGRFDICDSYSQFIGNEIRNQSLGQNIINGSYNLISLNLFKTYLAQSNLVIDGQNNLVEVNDFNGGDPSLNFYKSNNSAIGNKFFNMSSGGRAIGSSKNVNNIYLSGNHITNIHNRTIADMININNGTDIAIDSNYMLNLGNLSNSFIKCYYCINSTIQNNFYMGTPATLYDDDLTANVDVFNDHYMYTALGVCNDKSKLYKKTVMNITGSVINKCLCYNNAWKCWSLS